MNESNYIQLPITTEHAHRIDPIEYCQSIEPQVTYFDYRLYQIRLVDVFDADWIEQVNNQIHSPLKYAMVFYRESDSSIHQDYTPPLRGYTHAFNYSLTDADNRMTWYDTDPPSVHTTQYPTDPVFPVESITLPATHLTLVNTSRFHAIHTNTPRWTMSLRTDTTETWQELKEYYTND